MSESIGKFKLNTPHLGDWVENTKDIPDQSINCVLTSPPYYGLRDYGEKGQIGLEDTSEEFITNLCNGFEEIKRALRNDGTCWVNIGDIYNKEKSLYGTPFSFAFLIPSICRSCLSRVSNSANTPNISRKHFPSGVFVLTDCSVAER